MPTASDEESANESIGLRVGRDAWKWPPVWPYDQDMFKLKIEEAGAPSPLGLLDVEKAMDEQKKVS